MPAMFLAHAVGAPLEARFVVVHWDQRGAGKSFRSDLPPDSLSVETILADAEELIERLRRRFAKQRVFLVGHSWGSYLGMILAHRRPELVQAFVGVGQTTHAQRQKEIADRFLRRQARETGRLEVLAALDDESFGARERWLFEFGAELHGETSFLPLLLTGLRAPEYTLVDAWNVARGSSFSSTHMRYDALDGELMDSITRLEVPVYFFQGRYDYVTPTELAAEYLDRLQAPRKRLVRFDAAAHFPFFEQPQAFAREMVRVLEESRLQGSPPAPPGSGPGRQDSGTAPP
jgi:proline iminopeptidase